MQQTNSELFNPLRDRGELFFAVRVDNLPTFSRDGFAAGTGRFTPLTVDEFGWLRTRPKDGADVKSESVEDLLAETNSLLRRLLMAVELTTEIDTDDPDLS